MRFFLALTVAALAPLHCTIAIAQTAPVYYCDAWHAYYPGVLTCPAPWRVVGPAPAQPQPEPRPASPAPQTAPAARSDSDIDDELSGWCAEARKASSVVICSDRDLRQMALIRNKIFANAWSMISPDAYKQLLVAQNEWVKTYSSSCGVPMDGPEPAQPIASRIVDCFKRESQNRIADLVSRLRQEKAAYYPTSLSMYQRTLVDQAINQRADRERAEQQRQQTAAAEQVEHEKQQRDQEKKMETAKAKEQAEREKQQREQEEAIEAAKAKEQLYAQALADRQAALEKRLQDRGFKLEKPIDFELDWHDLAVKSQKVALEGKYVEQNGVEGLVVDNPDLPLIRLYTDGASRDARKMLLECRINDSSCKIIVGASVISCLANKDRLNEKELPCLKVEDAFTDPTADQ